MFNRQWFLLILVPALSISRAGAATPGVDRQLEAPSLSRTPGTPSNGTVAHQVRADSDDSDDDDDGEGPVYYAGFCGIDLRDSMANVHDECDKNLVRVVLQDNPATGIPIFTKVTEQRPTNRPQSRTQCDHFLELQVVNSIAMSPVDDAPGNNNGACAAINAMLDVMDGKFPTGQSYSNIKTSFIRESPLFTQTNVVPNTYWIDTDINQLKGKLIRRFLTLPPQAQITALNDDDKRILPALKSYMRDLQINGNGLHLAADLEDEWQPLIDRFHDEVSGLVLREWPPTLNDRTHAVYLQKMAQLDAGKAKFINHAARLDDRFPAAASFILNYPQL
ncbi:hypothetical protein C8R43DRAFT_675423 [Mycena crocata]|nr:hypothetical protein C8R43DRAFT_675423 [Mycena crocata]